MKRNTPRLSVLFSFLAVFIAGVFLFNCNCACAQADVDSQRIERQTTEGEVIGVLHRATDTISWKGIPYAKPPVGELRWKAPVPPEKRTAPLAATDFKEPGPHFIDHDKTFAQPPLENVRLNLNLKR